MVSFGIIISSIFIAFAALTLIQAILFGIQAWEHARYAKSRFTFLGQNITGRAMVFVPCKGLDLNLEKNIESLFQQDYDHFEIRFLVESETDPAYKVLEKLIRRHPEINATIVITGIATICGQKVHNLRVATQNIPPQIRYLVFMDSDAHLQNRWLRAMLFRIGNEPAPGVGAVTGYRWMVPTRATLGNCLVYAINSTIATLFGKFSFNPIWGGSWAIHRTRFEELGIREAWERTISDDLIASKVIKSHQLRVLFEPISVVASPIDFSFREAISFVRRQYTIGRFHVPRAWLLGLFSLAIPTILWWGALTEGIRRTIVGGQIAWGLFGFCAAIYATMVLRGLLRQKLATLYAGSHKDTLRTAIWFDILAGPFTALMNTFCMILSAIGSRLTWRRIIYTLNREGTVRHIKRVDALPEEQLSKIEPTQPNLLPLTPIQIQMSESETEKPKRKVSSGCL